MNQRITIAKHTAKKLLCDAYLFVLRFDKSEKAKTDAREIDGYRRNHIQKLKELRK